MPGGLLNANNSGNPVVGGRWNNISITDTPVTSGTAYWLGAIMDTNDAVTRVSSANPYMSKSQFYCGFNWPSFITGLSFANSTYLSISGWGTLP